QVAGLLDLHYRQDAALARLHAKIRREAAGAPRVLRFPMAARRLVAAAALLLVTFGLGLGLAPVPGPGERPGEPLAARGELEVVPPPVPALGGQFARTMKVRPERAKPFAAERNQVPRIDLEGKSLARWRREVEEAKKGAAPPLPRVGVQVVVRNPG